VLKENKPGDSITLDGGYDVKEMIDYHKDISASFKKGYGALEKALGELSQVKMFVDSNEEHVNGLVFILGRLKDGSVAGLETSRVWT
jgi:hypothetical protein